MNVPVVKKVDNKIKMMKWNVFKEDYGLFVRIVKSLVHTGEELKFLN